MRVGPIEAHFPGAWATPPLSKPPQRIDKHGDATSAHLLHLRRSRLLPGCAPRCFDDRSALLRAVVIHDADSVLGDLPLLDGWEAMRAWFDALVDLQLQRRACGGCPIRDTRRAARATSRRGSRWQARSSAGKHTCAMACAR